MGKFKEEMTENRENMESQIEDLEADSSELECSEFVEEVEPEDVSNFVEAFFKGLLRAIKAVY